MKIFSQHHRDHKWTCCMYSLRSFWMQCKGKARMLHFFTEFLKMGKRDTNIVDASEIWYDILNMKYEKWKYEMWNPKCEIWNMKYGKYEIWSMKYEISNMKYEMWNVKQEISNMKYEIWGMKCEIWNIKYEIWNMRCEIWNMRYKTASWAQFSWPITASWTQFSRPITASWTQLVGRWPRPGHSYYKEMWNIK